jgi:ABC-type multidrug transport system ATPase subunit
VPWLGVLECRYFEILIANGLTAMVTKASTQCWDNSTRGLDSSTALEYVQSLRSLTNMSQVSTMVALYQAGENLYNLFDKVLLIHKGKCAYFGPADEASLYFKNLGFVKVVCQNSLWIICMLTSELSLSDGQQQTF